MSDGCVDRGIFVAFRRFNQEGELESLELLTRPVKLLVVSMKILHLEVLGRVQDEKYEGSSLHNIAR